MSDERERLLVAGAGIAGLGVALAFGDTGREIVLIDRDPPPPDGSPEDAFARWERRGATQLRHSHVFLGRLTALLRDRHPRLLEELQTEGARIFHFRDGIAPPLRENYVATPGDENLEILFSRRTTLEFVMRRYVARLPNVDFMTETGVTGVMARRDAGMIALEGLKIVRIDHAEELRGDVIVDASGRNSVFSDWLRAEGAEVSEEESPAGILYYTRHYRLRDGADEPVRDGTPGAGDLGYIKFGIFAADNRHFSITLAIPEIETSLRKAIVKPEVFEAICAALPACARWTNPARSEPASPVYSMGNLKSAWRSYLKNGEPQVVNFFTVGDAAVRTNPLYGRGCSAGIVHAHILREIFDSTDDPRERARAAERQAYKVLRPFYDTMAKQDAQAIGRAEHQRDPSYKPGLRARMMKSFAEDAIVPALRGDIDVARAFSRAFHMIDDPAGWMKRPEIVMKILRFWAMPNAEKRTRGFYPPDLGPKRDAMFVQLGLAI